MNKGKIRNTAGMLMLLLSQAVCADQSIEQARTLLEQRRAGEAFTLLEPLETARAGEVDFDLLFGIVALDVGQNTRGVFALERVLAVQPENARARAEIARAYLALGETQTARQEFETVQKQGVPPEVSATIDRFLDAVDRLESVSLTTLRGYLETSLGYDTNVNAAPNRNSVAIPGFGGLPFTLSGDSKATAAPFGTIGGGINLRSPLDKGMALVGGASGVLRNNFGERQFDSLNSDAYAGVVFNRDKDIYSFNAQFNQYVLESDRYRTASGVSGQWQRNLDARTQVSAFAQYSGLRYQTQSVRDARRWVAGGAFAGAGRSGEVIYLSGYAVNERPKDSGVPWLGFDGLGVRLGGQMNWDARTVLFASASIEYRDYRKEDPSFLKGRRDTQYDLVFGLNYTPARTWTVTPRLTLTRNESNTELNQYHREALSVTLRHDF